ncbi:hypothetical protein [Saccharopolyspora sp. ASAGF58]
MFGDLEMLEPGLVDLTEWRPDSRKCRPAASPGPIPPGSAGSASGA